MGERRTMGAENKRRYGTQVMLYYMNYCERYQQKADV